MVGLSVQGILDAVGHPRGLQHQFDGLDGVYRLQIHRQSGITALLGGPTGIVVAVYRVSGGIAALDIGGLGGLAEGEILPRKGIGAVFVRFGRLKDPPLVDALVVGADDLDTDIPRLGSVEIDDAVAASFVGVASVIGEGRAVIRELDHVHRMDGIPA